MNVMYCPRCGEPRRVTFEKTGKRMSCLGCTWKILWVGPIWGEDVR